MTTLTLMEGELRMLALRVKELEALTLPLREAQEQRAALPKAASDAVLVAELVGWLGGKADEVMGPSRERRVVGVRRMLVRHLRTQSWTWPRIAAVFGISERAARKLEK